MNYKGYAISKGSNNYIGKVKQSVLNLYTREYKESREVVDIQSRGYNYLTSSLLGNMFLFTAVHVHNELRV